jgi:hypothetical protein
VSDPTPEQVFRVNEEVVHREVEGQIVLLLPDDYALYTLNASGKLVWSALVEARPVGEIVARVAERFGIPAERAGRDVRQLLRDLEGRAIIRRS